MKDDDLKLLRGFDDRRTNGRTDICECRVAFATEKPSKFFNTTFDKFMKYNLPC